MTPNEADAGTILGSAGKESHVFKGTFHDKTGSNLGACIGLSRFTVEALRPAVAEAAEPTEWRVFAQLLLTSCAIGLPVPNITMTSDSPTSTSTAVPLNSYKHSRQGKR